MKDRKRGGEGNRLEENAGSESKAGTDEALRTTLVSGQQKQGRQKKRREGSGVFRSFFIFLLFPSTNEDRTERTARYHSTTLQQSVTQKRFVHAGRAPASTSISPSASTSSSPPPPPPPPFVIAGGGKTC
jgi:hypothetical protein